MRLLASLLLFLFATPAWGATYWVSPTGAGGATGADSAANAKTLAWFNANAVAGDVCRFKSGTYTDPINPTNNGTSGSGTRIRYYGFPNDPGAVRVTNLQLGRVNDPSNGDYITVRWITTTSGFSGNLGMFNFGVFPTGDSIVACRSAAANSFTVGGKYHVVDSLTLSGTNNGDGNFLLVTGGFDCKPSPDNTCNPCRTVTHFYRAASNRITNSTFTWSRTAGTGSFQAIKMAAADSTVISGNTFTLAATNLPSAAYFFVLETYNCDYNWIQDNTWNITNNVAAGTRGLWSLRDWSVGNRFFNNDVTVTGTGSLSFMLSNSGSCGASTTDNYYGYNTIKVNNPESQAGVLWFYDGSRRDTVEFNTIATSSTRPLITTNTNGDSKGSLIRHNTFFTAGPTAIDLSNATGDRSTPTRLASNVYYCQAPNTSSYQNLRVVYPTELDSSGCYFSLGATASASNAIYYGGVTGAPGAGGVLGGAENAWGSPRLADSTYAALDARATSNGYAVGAVWHDGYAGVGVYDVDVTAPAVSITYPADTSYTWSASETMPLTWTASDAVGVTSIAVDYGSTDDPAVEPTTWVNVTTLGGAVVNYDWIMSGVSTRYGFVRVRAFDLAGNVGSDTQVYKFNYIDSGDPDTFRDVP